MQVPIEFKNACRNLHQDIGLFASTPEELVDAAVEGLSTQERATVKKFLDKVLEGLSSGVSLKNVWRATGSDVYFPKSDDLLLFLRLMQARLG
jgi:hypothetical protein